MNKSSHTSKHEHQQSATILNKLFMAIFGMIVSFLLLGANKGPLHIYVSL